MERKFHPASMILEIEQRIDSSESDSNVAIATKKLQLAWKQYQRTERYGLEFGRVCCELRDEFEAKGKRKKGDGVVQSWNN
jgi:hypothetical protein